MGRLEEIEREWRTEFHASSEQVEYLLRVARAAERMLAHIPVPNHAHMGDTFICAWPCPRHDYDALRRALEDADGK